MWNGELASTNLWFTYFNGVRRIVGTKIMQGKGELTFKTTKKVICQKLIFTLILSSLELQVVIISMQIQIFYVLQPLKKFLILAV